MSNKVTISTIAKEAGVSKTTISRYLNGNYGYMSEATRTRIAQIIEAYGYVPNGVARTLKSKKSHLIGIIVHTMGHNVVSKMVMGMQRVFDSNGYATVVCCSNDDPAEEDAAIQICLNQQVDGIILVPCRDDVQKYQELYDRDIPIMLCSRRVQNWQHGSVYVDHITLIQSMMQHLKEQGFDKVRFLLDVNSFNKHLMAQEFTRLAAEYFDMNEQEAVLFIGREEENVRKGLEQYLDSYPGQRKAVMAVNTHTLFLVLDYLTERGIRIPDELGVCGYDALGWSKLVAPGISAMCQPMSHMGSVAGEQMMLALREKRPCEKIIVLDGEVYYRPSTILQ